LQISVTPVKAIEGAPKALLEVKVAGADRKGILREVSSRLSSLGINLEELETQVSPAPMSGETMFSAIAQVSIPQDLNIDHLRDALEQLSDDLIVEIKKI
jgi:glycine cleavage system regulatory protein